MDKETLFWLFSTIAQSYGAIVGIIGLLVIYRLENQSRLRGSIMTSLLAVNVIREAFVNVKVTGWLPEDMSHYFHNPDPETKKNIDSLKNNIRFDLKDGITKIDRSVKLGTEIRQRLKSFVSFHLGLIIGPIILIHFVSIPFSYSYAFIRPVTFVTILIILIIVLFISCKMIWSMAMTLLDEKKKVR
jgi:hypothetical protein